MSGKSTYRQDMPPKGGFDPVHVVPNTKRKGFSNLALLAIAAGLITYGLTKYIVRQKAEKSHTPRTHSIHTPTLTSHPAPPRRGRTLLTPSAALRPVGVADGGGCCGGWPCVSLSAVRFAWRAWRRGRSTPSWWTSTTENSQQPPPIAQTTHTTTRLPPSLPPALSHSFPHPLLALPLLCMQEAKAAGAAAANLPASDRQEEGRAGKARVLIAPTAPPHTPRLPPLPCNLSGRPHQPPSVPIHSTQSDVHRANASVNRTYRACN